jgi:hypothetical protein
MVADQQIKSASRMATTPYRNYKMKKMAATVALLCVSSTVLAHDIFSDLRDRDGKLVVGGRIVSRWKL